MGVFVARHALKHGLSEAEVLFAWENFARLQHRRAPNEDVVVAVGFLPSGKPAQLVAIEKGEDVLIYHAMCPPTQKVLRELGLIGGR